MSTAPVVCIRPPVLSSSLRSSVCAMLSAGVMSSVHARLGWILLASCLMAANAYAVQEEWVCGLRAEYGRDRNFSDICGIRTESGADCSWNRNRDHDDDHGHAGGGDHGSQGDDGVPPRDATAVRWTGQVCARYSETYTFTVSGCDGVRLWIGDKGIDGKPLVDQWRTRTAGTCTGTVALRANQACDLRLEHFNASGESGTCRLSWSSRSQRQEIVPRECLRSSPALLPAGNGTGLRGTYFRDQCLTDCAFSQVDPTVDFCWGQGRLDRRLGSDRFSVRWQGRVLARTTGRHTFSAVADDGVRLWVDGRLLVDKWIDQAPTAWEGGIDLVAGRAYDLKAEYYEAYGGAQIQLAWAAPGLTRQVIPATQLFPAAATPCQPPVVSLSPGEITVDEADRTIQVSVRLSRPATQDVGVHLLVGGNAQADRDYRLSCSLDICIPAGQTEASIPVRILDDALAEDDETIQLSLGCVTSALRGCDDTTIITIRDDDRMVGFTVAASSIRENAGSASIGLTLSAPSSHPVTVAYRLAGTASPTCDYRLAAGTVTFATCTTTASIPVPIVNDTVPESDETLILTLADPVGARLGGESIHTLTIQDDDRPQVPVVQWQQAGTSENEEVGSLVVQLQLDRPSAQPVTVDFDLGGTATLGDDYQVTRQTLVIPAGQTNYALRIFVCVDQVYDPDETIILTLHDPTQATLGARKIHTVTLRDNGCLRSACPCADQPLLTWTVATQSVAESVGTVTATAKLDRAVNYPVTVAYRLGGTATRDVDVTGLSARGILTFAPNATTATVSAQVVNDALSEPDETVILSLEEPAGARLGSRIVQTITIRDDDQATFPALSFAQATSIIAENGGTAVITVQLSRAAATPVTATLALGGTATAGSDFTSPSTSLTIPAGATTGTVRIPITDDVLTEPTETVILTLTAPGNAVLGSITTHTLSITDNDALPVLAFRQAASSISEQGGSASIVVDLDHASTSTVTANLTFGGTATAGSDYTTPTLPLTIPAGATSVIITIPVLDDAIFEPVETVVVTLAAPVQATLGTAIVHTLSIIDDESLPTVGFAQATSSSGESGGTAAIIVRLDHASSQPVTAAVAIAGTATPGVDFTAPSASVTIPAGQLSTQISVPIINDALHESDETVALTLSAPTGAQLGTPVTHTLTIVDDDAVPRIGFGVVASSVDEAVGTAQVAVTLSTASALDVTVTLAVGGTATLVLDHSLTGRTFTIPAGQTSASIPVPVIDDRLHESDETVVLTLSAPTGATLSPIPVHTLTIRDNDPLPLVAFRAATSTVGEAVGQTTVAIALSNPSADPVRVTVSLSGSADPSADYQAIPGMVEIPAGATELLFPLTIVDDRLHEVDETIQLTLTDPVGGVLGTPAVHVLTIHDNDPLPVIAFAAPTSSITEGDAAISPQVVLDAASSVPVTIQLDLGGTATLDADYRLTTRTLTIPAGETAAGIPLSIIDDAVSESDETIVFTLRDPNGATLGQPSIHTTTIHDNDGVPTVSFVVAASSAAEGAGTVQVALTLSRASAVALTIPLTVSGTATIGADGDILPVPSTVTVPAGTTTFSLPMTIRQDQLDELDETVAVTLAADVGTPARYTLGSILTHTLTVLDDDAPPTVAFVQAASAIAENGGTATIAIALSAPSGLPVTVSLALGGTATAGSDYTPPATTVTIPAGATSASVVVPITDDTLNEVDETVVLVLVDPQHATLGSQAQHTLTIQDHDPLPLVSFTAIGSSVGEGAGSVPVLVRLSAVSGRSIVVDLMHVGTATADADYHVADSIIIAAGLTEVLVPVQIIQDTEIEGDESVFLVLSNPVGATLGSQISHEVTIHDDDQPLVVRFAQASSSISENGGTAAIAVVLDHPALSPVILALTISGTATPGVDTGAIPASITIPTGATQVIVSVPIIDDARHEPPESVILTLAPPADQTAITIGTPGVHTLTIIDNDDLALTPILEYVQDNKDGSYTAFFGYRNDLARLIGIASGDDNFITPGARDQGQPVIFRQGRTNAWPDTAFSVPFTPTTPLPARLWNLAGHDATADKNSPRPPAVPGRPTQAFPPIVAITQPDQSALVPAGAPLRVLIGAYDPDGTVVKVILSVDGAEVAQTIPLPRSGIALMTPILSAGVHRLAATAIDDSGLSTTTLITSVRAMASPVATLTVSIAAPTERDDITISATASDPEGAALSLAIYLDGILAGSASSTSLTVPWSAVAGGTHHLLAVATAADGRSGSAPLDVPVNRRPTVSISSPTANQILQPSGPTIPLLATAADMDGHVTAVRFLVNNVDAGTVTGTPYRLDWTRQGSGPFTITATATDDRGAVTVATPVICTLNQVPTIAITAPVDGLVIQKNDDLVVTASAHDADGNVTRLLLFMNGACVADSASDSVTFSIRPQLAGDLVFTAQAFDNQGGVALAAPSRVRVDFKPVVTITSPSQDVRVANGHEIPLAATAVDQDGTVREVRFYADGVLLRTFTQPPYEGVSWAPTTPGFHLIQIEATDDSGGIGKSTAHIYGLGGPTAHWLTPEPAAVLVTGRPVILEVAAADADSAIASVTFSIGSENERVVLAAPWRTEWTPSSSASYAVRAVIMDGNQVPLTLTRTLVVRDPPAVVLTTNPEHMIVSGTDLTLSALATIADGTITTVRFENGEQPLATLTAPPYTTTMHALPSGTYRLTAVATDSAGVSTRSVPLTITSNAVPQVVITAPADGNVLTAGTPLDLRVSATDADDGVADVTFFDGAATLAVLPVTAGAAFPFHHITDLTPGTHVFTARARDTRGATALSTPVTVRSNRAPRISITTPPAGSVITQYLATPVTVDAVDAEGVARVDLLAGDTVVAQATAFPWSLTFVPETAGPLSLVARVTDNDNVTALSSPLAVIVNSPPTCALGTAGGNGAYDPKTGMILEADAADRDGTVVRVAFYDGDTLLGQAGSAPWRLAWFGAEAKPHLLTAVATDDHGASTVSGVLTVTVNQLPTVRITSPPSNTAFTAPATITLSADAQDADGTITGVSFFRDGVALGAATQATAGAPWILVLPALPSGTYAVTATATDNTGAASISQPVTFTLSGGPSVALTTPATNVVLTQGVAATLTATASGPAGIAQVEFRDGTTVVGRISVPPFTFTWLPSTPGAHTLTARAGDALGLVADSVPVAVTVNAVPTCTLEVVSTNAGYQLTAIPSDADGSIGEVRFLVNGTVTATRTAAPWTTTLGNLAIGRYEISAIAVDDRGAPGTAPARMLTVNSPAVIPPAVALTAPADGTIVPIGQGLTLAATASDADGTVARVEFYAGTIKVGVDATAPYATTWIPTAPGRFQVVAVAIDDAGNQSVSTAALIRVNAAPVVVFGSPADGAIVTADTDLSLLADAADGDGTIARVTFRDDGVVIGTAVARPYTVLRAGGFGSGTHHLTVEAQDDDGGVTVSPVVTVIANRLPDIQLTAPSQALIPGGQSVPLTAAATDSDGTIAQVQFLIDGQVVATDTQAPYAHELATLTSGSHQIVARARDNRGGEAIATRQVVVDLPPTVTLTAPLGGATLVTGMPVQFAALVGDPDDAVARVEFLVDGAAVATLTAAPWTATWTALTGTHSLAARATDAAGRTTTSIAVGITANSAPLVAITAPTDGTTVLVGRDILLTATASDDGAVASVAFFDGATVLATLTAPPYRYVWTGATARTHDLTAVATDDRGVRTTSAAVGINVSDGNQAPNVVLTQPSGALAGFVGDHFAFAATASDPDGAIARVEWTIDGVVVAQAGAAPYTGVWTMTPGTHQVAARAINDRGQRTASTPVTLTVHAAAERPQVAITAPAPSAVVTTGFDLAVTATAGSVTGSITQVEFFAGGTSIGVDTTAPYGVSWTPVALGLVPLTARVTDAAGFTATSAAVPVAVISTDLRIVITAPTASDGLYTGLTATIAATVFNGASPTKVAFFDGATLIGEDTTAPYNIPWPLTVAGLHHLTAVVTDYGQDAVSLPVDVAVVTDSGAPPLVALTDPATENAVIGLQAIHGTITAVNPAATITDWTLSWRLPQDYAGDLRLIAQGHGPLTNSSLGTFDTIALENGPYVLVLTGSDSRGHSTTVKRQVLLEGGAKPGEFAFTVNDLTIPVAGIPLSVLRSYSTLKRNTVGDFGYGWTSRLTDIDLKIDEERITGIAEDFSDISVRSGAGGRDVTVTLPDGRRTTFTFYFRPYGYFYNDGLYRAAPGIAAGLGVWPQFNQQTGLRTNELVQLFQPAKPYWTGTQGWVYSPWQNYDFPGFQLGLEDGTRYIIEREDLGDHMIQAGSLNMRHHIYGKAHLASIIQPDGNRIVINPDSINHQDPLGVITKRIKWVRDAEGRITKVYDPQQQTADGEPVEPATLRYGYDDHGDLVKVEQLVTISAGGVPTYQTTINAYGDARFPHYLTSIKNPVQANPTRVEYDDSGKMVALVGPDGTRTELTHDVGASTETIKDSLGNSTTMVYDKQGNVLDTVDALGHKSSSTYDVHNKPLTETDALGHVTTMTYDAQGHQLSRTDALGHTTAWSYDAQGHVLSETDARGNVTTNTYNADGNLTSMTDALGFVTRYGYVGDGKLGSLTDALGNTTSYSYTTNGDGETTTTTDPQGAVGISVADAKGNVLSNSVRRRLAGGGEEWAVTRMTYDRVGRLISTVHPDGSTTSMTYHSTGQMKSLIDQRQQRTDYDVDAKGHVTKVTYPDGATQQTEYDGEGRRTASIDAMGRRSTYRYDEAGRLRFVVGPDGLTTETRYNAAGRVVATVDATGKETVFGYDDANRQTQVVAADGGLTQMAYDAMGNIEKTIDPTGQVTSMRYDALNRRYETQAPSGAKKVTTFDALGRTATETDEAGNVTAFGYDAVSCLRSVTDASGQQTQYAYDDLGNQTSQIDAAGRQTQFWADLMGRRQWRKLPLGQQETFTYDLSGNLSTHTSFRGFLTTRTYDERNRLVQITPDPRTGEALVGFSYFADGRRAQMGDGLGQTDYTYDAAGRLSVRKTPLGSIGYGYDAAGRLASVGTSHAATLNGGNPLLMTYSYDVVGRLAWTGTPLGLVHTSYDSAGRLNQVARADGQVMTYRYNGDGHLDRVEHKRDTTITAWYGYALDARGWRTGVEEGRDGAIAHTLGWEYDNLGRLTKETISGDGQIGYTYDAVGNRQDRASSLPAVPTQALGYDANDRLAVTGYAFDASGNTIQSPNGMDEYDSFERLVKHTATDHTVTVIRYDGDSNKVAETVNGVTRWFLVDRMNPTGYAQTIHELSGPLTALKVERSVYTGLDVLGYADHLTTGSEGRWLDYDGHGTVRGLVKTDGTSISSYDYDAFGVPVRGPSVAQDGNRYRYAGEEQVSSLGLGYNRARYVDQNIGRFQNQDSWLGKRSNPASQNKYIYCANDPINRIDPTGRFDLVSVQFAMQYYGAMAAAYGSVAIYAGQRLAYSIGVNQIGYTVYSIFTSARSGYIKYLSMPAWRFNIVAGQTFEGLLNPIMARLGAAAQVVIPAAQAGTSASKADWVWEGMIIDAKLGQSIDWVQFSNYIAYSSRVLYITLNRPATALVEQAIEKADEAGVSVYFISVLPW